jgi:hypothetical protein
MNLDSDCPHHLVKTVRKLNCDLICANISLYFQGVRNWKLL